MKPLQVYLENRELLRLESWARERGWTKSEAVRVAVRALTRPPVKDPLLSLSGMVRGLPPDASAEFDRYLAETFQAKRRSPRRAPTKRRMRRS